MLKDIEPSDSFSDTLSRHRDMLLLVGLGVVLYNWFRIREKEKHLEQEQSIPAIIKKPRAQNKFSNDTLTQSIAAPTWLPLR